MSERTPFVCRDCGRRVSSTSYRATCPECNGTLGPTTVSAGGRRSADASGD
ncbi:MAG: rubrerythrin-like domain-containing protein [Haloferacaceae archaeon]